MCSVLNISLVFEYIILKNIIVVIYVIYAVLSKCYCLVARFFVVMEGQLQIEEAVAHNVILSGQTA